MNETQTPEQHRLLGGESFFGRFWSGDGGVGQALSIALPLTLSMSSFTIMNFVDRRFLVSYSSDTFGAAAPAGMLSFVFISFFMGTAAYVNTFVAQYTGVGRSDRVASAVWQGLYFALGAWVILAPLNFLGPAIFAMAGHGEAVIPHEIAYFRILIAGSGLVILNMVFSSFYSGRGKTWVVMWVRFAAMGLNIPLDYMLIFGKFGCPEMGITGAAIATVASTGFATALFAILVFSPKNRREFGMTRSWRFDPDLFKRLLKFGCPNGGQFVVDVFAWTVFLFMIGRLGDVELKATNAAWTLNMVIFMPMLGFAIAISTMVGQEIGRQRIDVAKRAVRNCFAMVFCYMTVIAALFVIAPRACLWLLLRNAEGEEMAAVADMAVVLLRFVAFYSLFDSTVLVFSSAIKGAGDTRFVMWSVFVLSTVLLVIPTSYVVCAVSRPSIMVVWSFATSYILVLSVVFYWRYRQGRWQQMRVIEQLPIPSATVEAPIVEA